jgi:transcriptional regulator with PAS, ATPase and Fis domain
MSQTIPFSYALNADENLFATYDYPIMTKERWESILQCKERFLKDENYDPRECPDLNPDVAESWVKCRNNGINPQKILLDNRIQREEFSRVLEKNHMLIKIAEPLFKRFKDLAISTGYGLYLTDNQGIFLLHEGEMLDLPINNYTLTGMLWDDNIVGTTAHSLCLHHKRPYILFGAENYSLALHNIIASAAPIFDENKEVIATIILGQILINNIWNEELQKLYSNTFGLITAIAAAIESQLFLQKSFLNLKMANHTLEATLALINEGIITIDKNGTIIYSNEEGRNIFGLMPTDVGRVNIREFLSAESPIMSLAEKGDSITIEETFYLKQNSRQYIVTVDPIMDEDTQELNVAILTINQTRKLRVVSNNRNAHLKFSFEGIIGRSDAINKAIIKGQIYGQSGENILLTGESGTGKELFAQAIHNMYCPNGPFVAVNCAALPRELIESELFGYEGGSFTGADRTGRCGKIEMADGGTLFLDEIGDMPHELQSVLLRVLEDKQVMRIGGHNYKKVDFRVIAATNQDLDTMVEEKRFRADLFYRLSVLSIDIPPLRKRNGDAEVLANYFIMNYCQKSGDKPPQLSRAAINLINSYDWPGNVRELKNAITCAVINARNHLIEPEHMPERIRYSNCCKNSLTAPDNHNKDNFQTLNELEKQAIVNALGTANGNVVLAACLLGISKSTIYRKIKEYNITV